MKNKEYMSIKKMIEYIDKALKYTNGLSFEEFSNNEEIVITNNTYTPAAIELANANNIELVDGKKIEKYVKEIIDRI